MIYHPPPPGMPYLNHCTMPKGRSYWRFYRPVLTVCGVTACEPIEGTPSFETHLQAAAWAEESGFGYTHAEVPCG